jgi:methyl-accepting chemotaxis protein
VLAGSHSQDGSVKRSKLAEVVRSIAQSSSQVKTLIDEVHVASEQQTQGMQQIAKAISQMEQVTQRAAAAAEEGAPASEEMSSQAAGPTEEVTTLETLLGASTGQSRAEGPAGAAPLWVAAAIG